MSHFGRLNEANVCIKQILAFFHGGTLCFDTLIGITVDLILEITALKKDGIDPLQYFKGRDNDKRLAMRLKERYNFQRDGKAYRIEKINEQAMCIGACILASKIVWKNRSVQCNSGVIACAQ